MNTTSTLSFANTHFFVGIDVHLKNWKVTIRTGSIELKTFSMNPSPLELLAYLNKHYPNAIYHIVYEAGFCGFWALRIFEEHNIDCIIVNPADIPTTNKEKVNKSDPIDSRKLSREHEHKSLHGIYIPSPEQEELRMLMRLRYRIVQSQTRTKNRIKGLLYSQGIQIPVQFSGRARWSHAFILWLESIPMKTTAGQFTLQNLLMQLTETREHNKNILKQLRKEAHKESIAPIINALLSVPGVAFITAMTLYTEIIDMKRFSDEDHLASFIGLVPSTQSTDDNIKSNSITKRQNAFLRFTMIETAWTAVQRIRHVWMHREKYQYALVA